MGSTPDLTGVSSPELPALESVAEIDDFGHLISYCRRNLKRFISENA
jgi:hypothetical protein